MKLNCIVTSIHVLGEQMEETNVVKKLLRAVAPKFLQIASTLEQFEDMGTMTVVEIVGRLKAHEERICGQSESAEGQLLLTHEDWKKRISKQGTNGSSNQKARGGYDNRGKGNGHFKLGNDGKGRHGQRDNVCS